MKDFEDFFLPVLAFYFICFLGWLVYKKTHFHKWSKWKMGQGDLALIQFRKCSICGMTKGRTIG